MPHVILSVRFLCDRVHGTTDNGERREWPPSPFRLFQAIVAGNATGSSLPDHVAAALTWLEKLPAPIIISPTAKRDGMPVLTYVLNNRSDTTANSRTPKMLRPTMLGEDRLVEYIWTFESEAENAEYAQVITHAVRRIRALGWGIDMAIGHGKVVGTRPGVPTNRIEYRPLTTSLTSGLELRVPKVGSLLSLSEAYAASLSRYESSGTTLLEPFNITYQVTCYTLGIARPYDIFHVVDAEGDLVRYPHAKLIHVAGMVRHVAIQRMKADRPSWEENVDEWINRVVRGKRDEQCSHEHRQFSYVPLPSIGHPHADAMIRNVMIAAPLGMDRELKHLAEKLDGESLTAEMTDDSCETAESQQTVLGSIELERFKPPPRNFINRCYLGVADTWHTVTPVILPGHDDHKPEKTVRLIQRALEQSGIEAPCEFRWQSFPFLKNCLSAHKYDRQGRPTGYFRPTYLKGNTMVHLRIRFGHREVAGDSDSDWLPANVAGPIVVGAGRHCGFGLMAAEDDSRTP